MDCSFISTTRCNDSLSHPSHEVLMSIVAILDGNGHIPQLPDLADVPGPAIPHRNLQWPLPTWPRRSSSVNKQLHLAHTSFRTCAAQVGGHAMTSRHAARKARENRTNAKEQ